MIVSPNTNSNAFLDIAMVTQYGFVLRLSFFLRDRFPSLLRRLMNHALNGSSLRYPKRNTSSSNFVNHFSSSSSYVWTLLAMAMWNQYQSNFLMIYTYIYIKWALSMRCQCDWWRIRYIARNASHQLVGQWIWWWTEVELVYLCAPRATKESTKEERMLKKK